MFVLRQVSAKKNIFRVSGRRIFTRQPAIFFLFLALRVDYFIKDALKYYSCEQGMKGGGGGGGKTVFFLFYSIHLVC